MRAHRSPLGVIAGLLVAWSMAAATPAAKSPATRPSGPETKPAAAEGKARKAGNIRFTPPGGWEVSEKGTIVIMNPPGETPKTCSVILVSGEVLPGGDFLKWFKDKWVKLCQGVPVAQGGEVTVQKGGDGVDVLYRRALLEDKDKNTTGLLFYAAMVGDGVEWAVFQTVGAQRFNQHNKAVSTMLSSLRFERKQAKPAPKTRPANGGAK
jgi:hypothetical protein